MLYVQNLIDSCSLLISKKIYAHMWIAKSFCSVMILRHIL